MNEVFNSLSLALIAFAARFVFDVHPALIAAGLAAGLWLVNGGFNFIVAELQSAYSRRDVLKIRRHQEGSITFAPIEDPVAASLAKQVTPDMTIADIEALGNAHQPAEIRNKTVKVER